MYSYVMGLLLPLDLRRGIIMEVQLLGNPIKLIFSSQNEI